MFRNFGSAQCPIESATREWIDERWNWLLGQFGKDRTRSASVILPTPEFFPDTYTPSMDGARVILDRVCQYMELEPALMELELYEDRNPIHEGNLQLGTAGLYQAIEGKYHICIEVNNLNDPLALVATMAHELCHVHLLGHGRISSAEEDHEPLTDLLTVFLGLGIITANAVIREAYWNVGHYSSWKIGRQGYLTMPMYGYALALFARARDEDQPTWTKELRADVRLPFKQSCRYLAEGGQEVAAPPADEASSARESPLGMNEAQVEEPPGEIEEDSKGTLSAEELVERYACGERDFRDADLAEALLSGVDLSGSNLAGSDLHGADLTNAVLDEVDLRDVDLRQALLQGALLRGANLSEADLAGADLTDADLQGADIRGADFRGATLHGTILEGTIRNRRTNLAGVDLSQVDCDENLTKESLRGEMMHDVATAWSDRYGRFIGLLLAGSLAGIVGGLLGGLLGGVAERIWGHRNLSTPAMLLGAALFAVSAICRVLWLRRREGKGTGKL